MPYTRLLALFEQVERRPEPAAFLALAERFEKRTFPPELRVWTQLFQTHLLEAADPDGLELLAPLVPTTLTGSLSALGPASLAEVIGLFLGAAVVVQDEATSYLTSFSEAEAPTLYSFHPHDWGLWPAAPSLADWLETRLLGAAVKEAFASDSILVRFSKLAWLVRALTGMGPELARLFHAAELAEDSTVGGRLQRIWAHGLLGNRRSWEAAAQVEPDEHPALLEAKHLTTRLWAGEKVRLGAIDLAAASEMVASSAPVEWFDPDRRGKRQRPPQIVNASEARAWADLKSVANQEPLVEEALALFEHLAPGGSWAPQPFPRHGGLAVDAAMARLAELLDRRFLPLLVPRLERSLAVPDTHHDAGFGLLLAWAAVARDVTEFEALLAKLGGTEQLGPRRLTELYRAFGRFSEPRATAVLAAGADAWLAQADDWVPMAPVEPFLQLLARDTVQTHERVSCLLERASFAPAHWEVCVKAAEAAGAYGIARAERGLYRAVSARLGHVDDLGRARVVRALAQVSPQAGAFLATEFKAAERIFNGDDPDDAEVAERDAACLLVGLLPLDAQFLGPAQQLLVRLAQRLAAQKAPRRAVLAAAEAAVWAVELAEARGLVPWVTPFRRPRLVSGPSAQVALLALQRRAQRVVDELTT